jgi:hypothetical protein
MEQNLKNHAKVVPLFHFFVLPVLMVNFVWSVVRVVQNFSAYGVIYALACLAILMAAIFGRVFALKVQDRVIRLEMRLRMHELLPSDLKGRILEFQPGQLIALRFAGDAELPQLARKVLDDKLTDLKSIKLLVRDWQGDFLRA